MIFAALAALVAARRTAAAMGAMLGDDQWVWLRRIAHLAIGKVESI
jgi:hypothetical protein